MPDKRLVLVGVGLLALGALALLFADTGALRPEDFQDGCGDWWCAPRNRLPIGLGILFTGLGILAIGIGLNGRRDDAPPDRPPHARDVKRRVRRRP
jgi:hypothetical protein